MKVWNTSYQSKKESRVRRTKQNEVKSDEKVGGVFSKLFNRFSYKIPSIFVCKLALDC